jgi:hypothetical protein
VPRLDLEQTGRPGSGCGHELLELGVEHSDLAIKRADAIGERFERELRLVSGGAELPGSEPFADRQTRSERFADGDLLPQRLRSGRDQVPCLQQSRGAAFTAPCRAILSIRIDSITPLVSFETEIPSPVRYRRAASSASTASLFPRRRRLCACGWLTSTTTTPCAVSARVSPAAYELVDSTATATASTSPSRAANHSAAHSPRSWPELLAAHQPTARVKRSGMMRVCVCVHPTNHDQGLVLRHGCPAVRASGLVGKGGQNSDEALFRFL